MAAKLSGAIVTINFQPSNDRATILQVVTDQRSGSKSTTTLTVTWGSETKNNSLRPAHSNTLGNPPVFHHTLTHVNDSSEGELPSTSKFKAENEVHGVNNIAVNSPNKSKFRHEASDDSLNIGGAWAGGGGAEAQPWRRMSGKDTRPIRLQVKGGEDSTMMDSKNQVLVYDMRKK